MVKFCLNISIEEGDMMPIYRPEYLIIGSNSTQLSQVIDKDLNISTSYPNPSSGRTLVSINLLVSGILQSTTVISSSSTCDITRTTLIVTIRIKNK